LPDVLLQSERVRQISVKENSKY